MKYWIYALIILPAFASGQNNLVPNGDFETYSVCPTEQAQIPPPWQTPTWNFFGSPDYYNACANSLTSVDVPENAIGHQNANSGNGYEGLICYQLNWHNGREYLQVKLNDTIIKRVNYQVNFWVSLADKSKYSISNIGAYFSQTAVQDMEILNFTLEPQVKNDPTRQLDDKENWMLITDTFVSETGGELYMTIGNFYSDTLTDSEFLSSGENDYRHAYYYLDDVSVTRLDTTIGINEKEENQFRLFPNPNNGSFTIQLNEANRNVIVELYDMQGRKVFEKKESGKTKQIAINTIGISPGVYFIRLETENGVLNKKFVKQ